VEAPGQLPSLPPVNPTLLGATETEISVALQRATMFWKDCSYFKLKVYSVKSTFTAQVSKQSRCEGNTVNSSAIAEMARVFLVNPDHGRVENAILDTNNVDFHLTTTLWYSSLNPVVGLYGPSLEPKVRRYATLS